MIFIYDQNWNTFYIYQSEFQSGYLFMQYNVQSVCFPLLSWCLSTSFLIESAISPNKLFSSIQTILFLIFLKLSIFALFIPYPFLRYSQYFVILYDMFRTLPFIKQMIIIFFLQAIQKHILIKNTAQTMLQQQYASQLYPNYTIKTIGTILPITLQTTFINHSSSNYFNLYCQIQNQTQFLFGLANIHIDSFNQLQISTENGNWFKSSFSQQYNITINDYLGPNSLMTRNQLVQQPPLIRFIVFAFFSEQFISGQNIFQLKSKYQNTQYAFRTSLSFYYAGSSMRITSNSFINSGQLSQIYASKLNQNNQLEFNGLIPNLQLSGASLSSGNDSFYNVFCQFGGMYLWGVKNINVSNNAVEVMNGTGDWLDSSFKFLYKINQKIYLGPNSNMTSSFCSIFQIHAFSSNKYILSTKIQHLDQIRKYSSRDETDSLSFIYCFSFKHIPSIMILLYGY